MTGAAELPAVARARITALETGLYDMIETGRAGVGNALAVVRARDEANAVAADLPGHPVQGLNLRLAAAQLDMALDADSWAEALGRVSEAYELVTAASEADGLLQAVGMSS